jgi:hypothetical protein
MTRQIISIGTLANDGTGDTLRAAAQKINDNFAEVYAANVDPNTPATGAGTVTFTYTTTRLNPTAARNWAMPDGTFEGQVKKIVNIATNASYTITLTGSTFAIRGAQVAQPVIPAATLATCEWYSGKWYVSFNNRESTQI